ncbi:unnamed protein product [Schistocephalus solidus]|uniref:Tenascin n=1 Tax=Schistocephalus solidus TaxID=70667 RepID=A0A183SFI9_SCHSO|nr:unnamed protein product [Schistocephalus solidus]
MCATSTSISDAYSRPLHLNVGQCENQAYKKENRQRQIIGRSSSMRLIVLSLLAALAVSAWGYPRHRLHHHPHGHADLKVKGTIYFDGCYEETCHKDHFYGFQCHDGYCKHVCDGTSCWEPEVKYFGGKAKIHGEVIFDGCYEETCHKGKYHGYQCFDGHCHHICDDVHCWEPELKAFKGKAHFKGEVFFDGCYEETCHKDHFYGFQCHDGYCKHVCDGTSCWEPEVKHFGGKARIQGEVIFDGCYEETCHKGKYHGYKCFDGHCHHICDDVHCWEPEFNTFKGKAHVEGEIIFEGCFEDTCHKGAYEGHKCHDGHCLEVCNFDSCWQQPPKTISGKAHFKGDIFFDGCFEETCHQFDFHGYKCHQGHCGIICDGNNCWNSEVATFAGKAKVRGEIIFDGCVEEICHKDHYDGYFCNHGHCGYVCHDDDCFSQDEYTSEDLFEVYDGVDFDDGYHYNFHY